jgi:hypothetical protein
MRVLITLLLLMVTGIAFSQENESNEVLIPKMLALNKSIPTAQKFNEEISRIAFGYVLAFVDEEAKPTIRYVYKTEKNQTLRMDFRYALEANSADSSKRAIRKPVIVLQKISGELSLITEIYNYLFNTNISPDRIMSVSTTGSTIAYQGHRYRFILEGDDYNPGYWVMTFVR